MSRTADGAAAAGALRSHRTLIMGRGGAVASNHPLATMAGLDMLRRGGSAADAAVATALALGVVEPHMSGLGGDGLYHLFTADTGASRVFNGTGQAPLAATAEAYGGQIPDAGPRSICTPGSLSALAALHAAAGRLPWAEACSPAVHHARHGFQATHAYRRFASDNAWRFAPGSAGAETLLRGNAAPALGETIVQEDLAATLEAVAAEGAATFYRGRIAEGIIGSLAGSFLGERDLAGCVAEVQEPILIRYRDLEVRQTPPNSMGFTLLQQLKLAERFDLRIEGWLQPGLVHLLVEAKKLSFLDRERFAADPRRGGPDVAGLLTEDYAARLSARIMRDRAMEAPIAAVGAGASGDTTYFCVVDGAGDAVSGIQSLNAAFGSGVVAGDTGILLNNRMTYWHLQDGHPNRLVPGARVRHTMNAPLVTKDGRLWGVLGTPGADNQVQVNMQLLVAMHDFGLDPQQAVEAPRWSSVQPGQDSNFPHGGGDELVLEAGFGPECAARLRELGHHVRIVGPLEGPCSAQIIRCLPGGVLAAGSDPRRDGWALAF